MASPAGAGPDGIAVLRVLSESGAMLARDVAREAFGETGRDSTARASRALRALAADGMAAPLDEGKPVVWLRTVAGTALAGADGTRD